MRILLLVHQFPPEHIAGTELVALDTALALQARGHVVEIFTAQPVKTALADSARFDSYAHAGLRVHRFLHQYTPMGEQRNIIELEYDNHLFSARLRAHLSRESYDVIHFLHLSRLSAAALDPCLEQRGRGGERGGGATGRAPVFFTPTDYWALCPFSQMRLADGSCCDGPTASAANCVRHAAEVARGPGPPVAVPEVGTARRVRFPLQVLPEAAFATAIAAIEQDLVPGSWWGGPPVRALAARPDFIRQRLNRLNGILPPSRFLESMLARNGIHRSRLLYLPHGVNTAGIMRNSERGYGPILRVGYLGRLAEHKGVHILIQALRQVPAGESVELHIHGGGDASYGERIAALEAADGRIHLHGPYRPERLGELLGALDCVVVPSLWYENAPLVLQAAQAAACPVIATNLGGMAEAITHFQDGLLFEPGEVTRLASYLRQLAGDRALLRRLAARAPVPKTISQYAADLADLYVRQAQRSDLAAGERVTCG